MLTRTEHYFDTSNLKLNFEDYKTSLNCPVNSFFYDPWVIKPEFKNTVWETILNSLPVPIGEARVIKMGPGTTYMAHSDIDDRYHLSLQGERSYLIDLSNNQMHLLEQDSFWYEMDAGRLHVASNFGSIDRYQLVVRKLLTATTETNLVSVSIEPNVQSFDYRYKFDNIVSPWLNSVNKKGTMRDFSFNGSTVNFKVVSEELDSLKLTNEFKLVVSYS